jgi:hypothetical protein
MADGGSLIPSVPASVAPIHVQMGGATYNASLKEEDERFSLENGEKIVDYNEIFPGLFTVRDITNNFKQYAISNGDIKKKYLLNDFDPLFRNEIKKFDTETQKRKLEKAGLPINPPITKSRTRPGAATTLVPGETISETGATSQEATGATSGKDEAKTETETETETKTKKSTIGDDSIVDKLREILRGDSEYQAVLALLGDAEPSKLRANIIFNPEYKIIADLLKQIVRFKVEQYALGLKEVRGEGESKAVAPATPVAEVGKVEAGEKPEVKTESEPVEKTEEKPEVKPEVKTEEKPEVKTEEKPVGEPEVKPEEGNPFNQFGPNTTAAAPTPVQANPPPAQGGVKSRKASRVLRKLKTMKKSKKHTIPLL